MLLSMTGFATKTVILEIGDAKSQVSLSLKSLNSRYFDSTCRFPHVLSHLETDFIKLFKKRLHRGHIYFTIHMSNTGLFKSTIEPSLPIVQRYIDAIKHIKQLHNIKDELQLNHILSLPNIFNVEELTLDQSHTQILFDATNELIDELINIQKIEGQQLANDVRKRIEVLKKEIIAIEKLSAQAIEQQKEKIKQALAEIGDEENNLAEARKNALYTMLDKIDIHEEIIRFKSHLESLEQQLTSPGDEKGKRLDFTLQELAREMNTISAKCSNADISALCINSKVELEKAREQVQNIV